MFANATTADKAQRVNAECVRLAQVTAEAANGVYFATEVQSGPLHMLLTPDAPVMAR